MLTFISEKHGLVRAEIIKGIDFLDTNGYVFEQYYFNPEKYLIFKRIVIDDLTGEMRIIFKAWKAPIIS